MVIRPQKRDRVQSTAHFVAVYDPALDTGYIYHTGDSDPQVTARPDGTYELDGGTHVADALPLDPVVGVEASSAWCWRSWRDST